jgi:Flp pilus assembly pilin Flp
MSTRKAFIALNRLRHAAANGWARYGLTRLILDTNGQDLVEYALLTTFIGFAGAAGWTAMQTALNSVYGSYISAAWQLWEPSDPVGAGS